MSKPLPLLIRFELHVGLGPIGAAQLLGMSKPGYMHIRNRTRNLQNYVAAHIDTMMRIPVHMLDTLIEERVHAAS